jgi:hypothetical protein
MRWWLARATEFGFFSFLRNMFYKGGRYDQPTAQHRCWTVA